MTRAEKAELIKKVQKQRQSRPVVAPSPAAQVVDSPSGLTGSEKQVGWATEIRTRVLTLMEADALRYEQSGGVGVAFAQQIREALPILSWERRAAKWIEHRNDEAFQLISWASDLKLIGENSLRTLA